ncbi:MAG: hypothetical protein ACI8ZB_005048 [Desulforhopalus sp.]|jgi:hypothetical protein
MMKDKQLIVSFLACCVVWVGSALMCQAAEKPVVAIKEAKVADSVSKATRRHLNLEKLLAEMEASFLATRKFDVVTRNKSSMEAIREEQQFAESDLAAGDAAESGALQNADYLVIPEVHRFAFYRKTHKVPNLQNKYFKRDHGTLEMNAQIVDTKTGQIKATFSLKKSFSTPEEMVNESGGVPNKKNFTDLAKGVSAQMADQFIALVFPVEIINLKGDKVYLNRGQDGGFSKGDVLNVYLKGEELIDPQTGENLGSAEEYIGKIKISRVNPKFTIATILQDKLEGEMSVGCVVRKP